MISAFSDHNLTWFGCKHICSHFARVPIKYHSFLKLIRPKVELIYNFKMSTMKLRYLLEQKRESVDEKSEEENECSTDCHSEIDLSTSLLFSYT